MQTQTGRCQCKADGQHQVRTNRLHKRTAGKQTARAQAHNTHGPQAVCRCAGALFCAAFAAPSSRSHCIERHGMLFTGVHTRVHSTPARSIHANQPLLGTQPSPPGRSVHMQVSSRHQVPAPPPSQPVEARLLRQAKRVLSMRVMGLASPKPQCCQAAARALGVAFSCPPSHGYVHCSALETLKQKQVDSAFASGRRRAVQAGEHAAITQAARTPQPTKGTRQQLVCQRAME